MWIKYPWPDVGKFRANVAPWKEFWMARARKILAASVIPWENEYGIAVVFERGNHLAYRVGDRDEAERQLQLALDDPDDPTVL
jgi:hypothetical protein